MNGPSLGLLELSGSHLKLDIPNYGRVISIEEANNNGIKELEFIVVVNPYFTLDNLEAERTFEITFSDVSNLKVSPLDYLPLKSDMLIDDILYVKATDSTKGLIRWEGDTRSKLPDPTIEFIASKMTVVERARDNGKL